MEQTIARLAEAPRPDPDGDVTLRYLNEDAGTTSSFRVSSKILRLASPVFSGMLSPSFKEGQELLLADCVEIDLEDDDPLLMSLVLDVFHFKADAKDYILDSERLARLAIHCDKYDCTRALGPWISTWFENVVGTDRPGVDLGFQLLAAYMFNDAKRFSEISKATLKDMAPNFSAHWIQEEILELLPTSISNAITRRIERTLNTLEIELQTTESLLRESRRRYEMSQLICVLCGRTLPGEAKKCHLCRNTHLISKYCTTETRVAEFFAIHRKVELWPTAVPFETCSISDITFRFPCTLTDIKHSCAAGNTCSLLGNLKALLDRVCRAKGRIVGICLPCARQDEWEDDRERFHECEEIVVGEERVHETE